MRDFEDKVVDYILLGIVTIILILKITNIITVPWVCLLAPLWVPLVFGFALMIISLIIIIINAIIKTIKENKNERN